MDGLLDGDPVQARRNRSHLLTFPWVIAVASRCRYNPRRQIGCSVRRTPHMLADARFPRGERPGVFPSHGGRCVSGSDGLKEKRILREGGRNLDSR